MTTLFTRIISGEIPSYKIYEDEFVYAFLDIAPQKLGHTLIVPKCERDHFSQVPEPHYSAIFQTAKMLSPILQKATGSKRICTMFVGYEIPHCHYHLIPTDTIEDLDRGRARKATPDELLSMQNTIIQELQILS
jgi:histidine triad (HIT) family protein